MFSTSDDSALLRQVQATHSPDGRVVGGSAILRIIENIFRSATPPIDGVPNGTHELMDTSPGDNTNLPTFSDMREALSFIIQKITCEMSCKCSGADAHATAMPLFKTLSNYSWDAKMVLSLATFAVNYGEFWLVAQLCTTKNSIAKSVAVLKQLPNILEHYNDLKPQFDALNKLITAILDLTYCIVEFKQQHSQYDTPAMSSVIAHFPAAAYWTIRSIVACNSQILILAGLGDDLPTTDAWQLSSLTLKVSKILEIVKKQISICKQQIDEKRQIEAFDNLVELLQTAQGDNMKVLTALICGKDDTQTLVDGSNKTTVSIEVLKEKHVLLLVSTLDDLSQEEIKVLDQMYRDSKASKDYQYTIIWLPIVDKSITWNEECQKKFEQLRVMMPWYSVQNPEKIELVVIKYIKEVWRFSQKEILISVDSQGKISNQNVFHMLQIWGNSAFPFTAEMEANLWKKEPCILGLLVNIFDVSITEWMVEKRIICLYGGEDMQWIKQFTKLVKAVVSSAKINFGTAYVGKKKAKEGMEKIINSIVEENLSDTLLTDRTRMRDFWTKLEGMLYSKLQHDKSDKNDQIMREIMTILSFDGSNQGWAIFWSGETREMARVKGKTAIDCLLEFGKWQDDAKNNGFLKGINNYLVKIHNPNHCYHIVIPVIQGVIPEKMACADCGRPMEKYFMYRCCID